MKKPTWEAQFDSFWKRAYGEKYGVVHWEDEDNLLKKHVRTFVRTIILKEKKELLQELWDEMPFGYDVDGNPTDILEVQDQINKAFVEKLAALIKE